MKTFALTASVLAISSLPGPRPRLTAQGRASLVSGVASADATPAGHYCNLGVFTPASLKRHQELVPQLAAAIGGWHELANGYVFQFSGKVEGAGEWLDGVRRCCPTLDYQVDFERRGGAARLRVTGDDGAKAFIREEFQKLFATKG